MRGWIFPENTVVFNFSNTILHPCLAWYAQGSVSIVLRNIRRELPLRYKLPLHVLDRLLTRFDMRMIKKMQALTKTVVANSHYCKSCYEQTGVRVDNVIYEPLDCGLFKPVASSPSADYALTYFGKETKYSVIKKIADSGVKIKAFGGKLSSAPKSVLTHSNIEALGWVDRSTLVELYSNALYTLFPFTDEEFGYVPAESMACGTPVLTYSTQGPSEVVVNDATGWLARDDGEMMGMAVRLWKDGEVCDETRSNCRKEALKFSVPRIARKWLRYVDGYVNSLARGDRTDGTN